MKLLDPSKCIKCKKCPKDKNNKKFCVKCQKQHNDSLAKLIKNLNDSTYS